MTTTWKIFDTKRQKQTGLIINVTYGCTVMLDSFVDRSIFELELEPSEGDFIPYEQVSEQVMMSWVAGKVGQQTLTNIETSLQQSVQSQKQAKEQEEIASGLPWRD
jgi:hypothetical protein